MMLPAGLSRLLFPPKCILCNRLLERQETDLCHACREDTPECPVLRTRYPFLSGCTALWHYEGNVRRSLLRYKFHGKRSYAAGYGRLLAMKLMTLERDHFDLLTWIPVSRRRRWRRGFDQVQLLAVHVGAQLNMEPLPLLRKRRDNPPQSGIAGQAQRRANVLGVYEAINRDRLAGKRILLLDDILTTGATAGECARVLLTAGASEVHCAVIAVARHHRETTGDKT